MAEYTAEINSLQPGITDLQYRVVDTAGAVVTALTGVGVTETIEGVSGNYYANITLPDSTVRIQWFTGSGDNLEFEGEELIAYSVSHDELAREESVNNVLLAIENIDQAEFAAAVRENLAAELEALLRVDAKLQTAASGNAPITVLPRVTLPGMSIIFVDVIDDGRPKNDVIIKSTLLSEKPVTVGSSYEAGTHLERKTGGPNPGRAIFQVYPGLQYRFTCPEIGLEKDVVAPPEGESANIATL